MNKYLIDLLNEENTVIIPGFGALTVVNRTMKEYMFMPYLKYDDGLLADFISKKENWPIGEAKNLISKYVNDITITLNKGGKYDFSTIGSFQKVNDEIVFENWKEQSYVQAKEINEFQDASNVITTIEVVDSPIDGKITPVEKKDNPVEESHVNEEQHVENSTVINDPTDDYFSTSKGSAVVGIVIGNNSEEKTSSTDKELIPDTSYDNDQINEESATDNTQLNTDQPSEQNPNSIADKTTPDADENESKVEETDSKMLPLEEQWNDDCEVPPIGYKPPVPKKPILEKVERDKKRGIPAFLWFFIGVLFIGGLTATGFYLEDIKAFFTINNDTELLVDKEDEEIEDIPVPVDTIAEDDGENTSEETNNSPEEEIKKDMEVKTNPVAPPSIVNNGNIDKTKPFQVIVGSFGEENNAQKLIAKLNSNGFDAAIYGVINGMHMVTIGSFNSETEYQTKKAQLEKAGPQWLFKKK